MKAFLPVQFNGIILLLALLPSAAGRAHGNPTPQTPIVFEAEGAITLEGVFELFADGACSQSAGITTREGRGADRYHADVSLPFKQGTNTILLMVTQDKREWQAGLARPVASAGDD